MGKIERLAALYGDEIRVPWGRTVSGLERVLMVVYEKEDERRLRARVNAFAQGTEAAGHAWATVDATTWFSEWMASQTFKAEYFAVPEDLALKVKSDFGRFAISRLAEALQKADDRTVVAMLGVAALYGFIRVSDLVRDVEQHIRGRLLVFFPGTREGATYRLLDARDGWNYLARCITLHGTAPGAAGALPSAQKA